MAKVHVYVRAQVSGTDAEVLKVQKQANDLKESLEALHGADVAATANVALDDPEPVVETADAVI
jgi:outer membrane protein TolC